MADMECQAGGTSNSRDPRAEIGYTNQVLLKLLFRPVQANCKECRTMREWNYYRWLTLGLTIAAMAVGPLGSKPVWAQKPKGDKGGKTEGAQSSTIMEIAKVEGRWDAFSQGIIKILNGENQEMFLKSENDTEVTYTAEAEPSWLMPGYMVRFSATFDEKNKPTAPLKAIEVFTPVTGRRLSPEQMREQTPSIYLEEKGQPDETKGLFAENNNNKKPSKGRNAKKDAITPGKSFRVVGQISGVQNNVLTVIATQPIQIEIDPMAVVTVNTKDIVTALNLTVKGDAVTVSGLRNPAQPMQIYSQQITIKASKKLTQAMPQGKRGKTTSRDKDKDDAKNSKDAKDGKDGKDKNENKKPNSSDKKPQ